MIFNNSHGLKPSYQLPLFGKRIAVTAPRNYAARLCQQIIEQGGLPLVMPTIETCWLSDYTLLDGALKEIDKFDWIAFTSRNGIKGFWSRLETLGLSPSILKSCRLAAIGKDAEELEAIGVEVNLVPEESSPTGIVAELRKMPDIQRQKILVPVPKVVGIPEPDIIPKFINGLEELDLDISVVPTYITRCLDKKIYEVELELIRQGKVDAIAFSSTAEIEAFLKMINCPQDYAQSKIACFGPYTAANAQRLGLEVAIVGEDYSSFAGFVEAIAQFFKYKK